MTRYVEANKKYMINYDPNKQSLYLQGRFPNGEMLILINQQLYKHINSNT